MRTVCRTFLRHRMVNSLLAVLVLFSVIVVGRIWSQPAPIKAAGGQTTNHVLIIHGFNGNSSPAPSYDGFDCKGNLADPGGAVDEASNPDGSVDNDNDALDDANNGGGNPSDAYNYFHTSHSGGIPNYAWDPITVGYYGDSTHVGDKNCDVTLQNYQQDCTLVPAQDLGSDNEDIRHLGCELAWYIYLNFTAFGEHVYVLAHSMGGLIIQWAIQQSGHDPNYPQTLSVPAVVTLSTPHGGVSLPAGVACLPAGDFNPYDECIQGQEMDPTTIPGNSFLGALDQNPQGTDGTVWNTISSGTDQFVPFQTALDMVGNQYLYSYNITVNGLPSNTYPTYSHYGIFADESDAQDAQVKECLGNCPANVGSFAGALNPTSNVYHPLALAYQLLGKAIPPPPPTPTPTPTNTPTPTPTSPPPPPCSPGCNTIGAGYDTTDWYVPQQIHANFVVPSLSGLDKSDMSMWIGFNNDPTESGPSQPGGYAVRVGVDGEFDDVGNLTYYAFWGVWKVTGTSRNPSTGVWSSSMTWLEGLNAFHQVSPGDTIDLTLWFSGSLVYFDFGDLTQKTGTIRYQSTTTPGFTVYSANWRVNNNDPNLANWSNSGFSMTNCQIMVNGAWQPITYRHYNQVALTTGTGKKLATPGGLGSGGTSFGVTFNAAK